MLVKKRFIAFTCFFLLFSIGILPRTSFAEDGKTEKEIEWIWPANGVITDTFGTRGGSHKGIDIAEKRGTEVFAVDGGTVTRSYFSNSYGNVIFIKHDTGLETVYAHLHTRLVKEGALVRKGEKIGLMGSTGNSSGPHLHFEVHKNRWTQSKENSFDPFFLFGKGEVGQYVFAGEKGPERIMAVTKNVAHKRVHIVKPGETLWKLAEIYETSVEALKVVNGKNDDLIYPEEKLIITAPSDDYRYKVKKGDTLFAIAKRYGISPAEIKRLNGIRTDRIFPDQELIIPFD